MKTEICGHTSPLGPKLAAGPTVLGTSMSMPHPLLHQTLPVLPPRDLEAEETLTKQQESQRTDKQLDLLF